MRRTFAIFVIVEFCIVVLFLSGDIRNFLWTHPWWHSFLVLIPGIAAAILALMELFHSAEANKLRQEANIQRERANSLEEERNKLTRELNAERNKHLGQIAVNTQRPLSEAEINAGILKKYIGQRASVSEGSGHWGAMGAVVAEVNDNNILTLFVPSSFSSSSAYEQKVRCDKLQVVEVPQGGCAVQLTILERYGSSINRGEAKKWEDKSPVAPTNEGGQRGLNVFSAQYRKSGSPVLRHIRIYAPNDGSPNFTTVTTEDMKQTDSWYLNKLDTEKKFALLQVEWANQSYLHNGGSGSGTLNLFVRK